MPPLPADDIKAWLSGRDEGAAKRLMEALHPRVSGIIRRHWSRAEEWEDLEQEVFLRIFGALPRYRQDVAPLEHWVSRITLNVCRKRWRSQSRRPEWRWSDLGEGEQQVYLDARQADEPLKEVESREARSLMYKLLDSLNADDRLILSLFHLEEKSFEEIASLTGLSQVAVRVRAFRARKKLHEALRKLEPGENSAT
ncbi:MAG: RNA polymerase sigma-70 factor, ECF subfamily [Verrucomicrobia bacterium]|nr:MAG: RNA polymerase sigma-70 factor, ECF subfamily [Verrucomicrobiota bacterium]